eukprot:TRINITY_DN22773_c0_g1_i1.p1 TRINITY_DN22773_c0_g1~~TRINITY_DN22773_c0_g1_i1.p1  ORF type:complete len:185 (-),score=42.97 TRINITY_DN22773_c0_g1_i1:113-667(-)
MSFVGGASAFGLEGRGVTYGVHDFRGKSRSKEEYQQLVRLAGCTRSRTLGVDFGNSTFNSLPRAYSYGAPGCNPKGEQSGPQTNHINPAQQAHMEHGWPQKVIGGFGFSYQGTAGLGVENHRKNGSLERNIVGDCSIKDDRFVYYGHSGKHYGMNSNTHNRLQYETKLPPKGRLRDDFLATRPR